MLAVLLLSSSGARASDVNYLDPVVDGTPINVIVVNLNSHVLTIRPIVAQEYHNRRSSRVRTFMNLVHSTHAVAAINGTYFDSASLRTIGNVVSNGHLVYDGYIGNAIAIDRDGFPHFLKVNRENGHHVYWKPYVFAITSGPTLVYDCKIALNPQAEGFRDPRVYAATSRTAIGVTANKRLLLVTVHSHVTLSHLARIMKDLGAEYALNLDGGSSSAMYYRGSVITEPGRTLTNILAICPCERKASRITDDIELRKGDLPTSVPRTGTRKAQVLGAARHLAPVAHASIHTPEEKTLVAAHSHAHHKPSSKPSLHQVRS